MPSLSHAPSVPVTAAWPTSSESPRPAQVEVAGRAEVRVAHERQVLDGDGDAVLLLQRARAPRTSARACCTTRGSHPLYRRCRSGWTTYTRAPSSAATARWRRCTRAPPGAAAAERLPYSKCRNGPWTLNGRPDELDDARVGGVEQAVPPDATGSRPRARSRRCAAAPPRARSSRRPPWRSRCRRRWAPGRSIARRVATGAITTAARPGQPGPGSYRSAASASDARRAPEAVPASSPGGAPVASPVPGAPSRDPRPQGSSMKRRAISTRARSSVAVTGVRTQSCAPA